MDGVSAVLKPLVKRVARFGSIRMQGHDSNDKLMQGHVTWVVSSCGSTAESAFRIRLVRVIPYTF